MQTDAYHLAQKDNVLAANKKDAALDISVLVTDKDSLSRILQHEVRCRLRQH